MEYYIARFLLQKGLAFIYLIAFLIIVFQGKALLGEKGILPAKVFIRNSSFFKSPSIFFLNCSDLFFQIMGWVGVLLAVIALSGFSEMGGLIFSMINWFLLWSIYLSFVNIGQIFYGYGWEILLLESGFLAIFLGSADIDPSIWMIWLYRWVLFRVMFGAGLIKLRGDLCWKNLTTMFFHYETQPLPGPLSRFFHRLPRFIHKLSVLFTHFIELVVPFFVLFPGQIGGVAGLLMLLFQGLLILSGNLSWLNYITAVLCFSCFSDEFFPFTLEWQGGVNVAYEMVTVVVCAFILYLSVKPIRNMISPRQMMNCHFDPLNLVNSYGAFGSVTKVRREIVLEGTRDKQITESTEWMAYEFKGKPGCLTRRPPLVSPYHYKIDWQMWFAAMTFVPTHEWFFSFIVKILQGNKDVLSLLRWNPFGEEPPIFIRAELYEYHFAPSGSPKGVYWVRKRVGSYLQPCCLTKKD